LNNPEWPGSITGVHHFQAGAGIAASRDRRTFTIGHGLYFVFCRSVETAMKQTLAVIVLTALVAAGCAARGVRVAELKDQPAKYATKSVSVTGVVTSSWGIPLMPFQLYNIDDGSGEITVLSRSGGVLSKGTRVQVKGKINQFANFGGRSVGLHIQEEDRKIRS
jgi:hypothetical protein